MDLTGPQRFARFAFPPNDKGFCGPEHAEDTFALATESGTEELVRLVRSFEGAYPYLELLAGAAGGNDPLDPRVVEAYWIGNDLLTQVSTFDLGRSLEDRFRRRAGRQWEVLNDAVATGCANHCFLVLSVTPWVGLMRAGLVDEVKSRLDEPGTGLSGGQQQRLCIARTIAVNPEVILMDEPCSALDPIATARIEDLIDELSQKYAIAIVTHSMQQAARVSNRTAYFHLGRLVEVGPTDKIFTNPSHKLTEDYITGRFG